MTRTERLTRARRWVVKIGSALLTNNGQGLDEAAIGRWVAQMIELRRQGIELILVSSGAVAAGMRRLGWTQRPDSLSALQAAASVGQAALVQTYEEHFQRGGLHTGQILLTHEDLRKRGRYLNARGTLRTLVELGVVPIINENDTVATEEIRFGDNDTLAALVSNLVEADLLVILTDQQGLYEADPRRNPEARLLPEVVAGDPALEAMAGGAGSGISRGGMLTKVRAAGRAARSGTATLIASGHHPDVLLALREGAMLGTYFSPRLARLAARKQWLAGQLQVQGKLFLDAGAARVLREEGRSLLPVGVTRLEGNFQRGDLVACLDPEGREVARGLVNYDWQEAQQRLGRSSTEIAQRFGALDEPELVHRDNLVLSGH
ncbi:glutamate 5-kinase [Thermithiobacillus plumbiphilus]|uniref:Glutamate 5-kinase n=1 Tax=Thermithiobacillus plumbiphilus TaxID=1729899 RepID=A0ABU9DAB8_9PROT